MGAEPEKNKETSEIDGHKDSEDDEESLQFADRSKKDPSLRRFELLMNSGLAEVCLFCCTVMLCTLCIKWVFIFLTLHAFVVISRQCMLFLMWLHLGSVRVLKIHLWPS